mmetsp:Transcript_30365/g.93999  ORF Transcript_30365/g.93999 Transcript_30365/m.93999 type:complete len:208 (-) Transcript_30365:1002-1625(-)
MREEPRRDLLQRLVELERVRGGLGLGARYMCVLPHAVADVAAHHGSLDFIDRCGASAGAGVDAARRAWSRRARELLPALGVRSARRASSATVTSGRRQVQQSSDTVGGFALRRREALSDARARRLVTSLSTFGARFGTRSAQRGVHVTFAPKLGRRSGAPRLARAAARRTAGPRVRRESPAPFDERRAPPAAVWVSVHLTPSGHGRA